MRGSDLSVGGIGDFAGTGANAVVGGHVDLELLRVGARGGLPAGVLLVGVEVVGEVLGVGVSNLPAGGKASVGLCNGLLVNGEC